MERDIYVKVIGIENINGLECLGERVGNINIVRLESDSDFIDGSECNKQFDVVIKEVLAIENNVKLFNDKTIYITRLPKDIQQMELKKLTDRFRMKDNSSEYMEIIKNYHELKVYSDGGNITKYLPSGKYILKPKFGARSLGIMEFDSTVTSAFKVTRALESIKRGDDINEVLERNDIKLLGGRERKDGEEKNVIEVFDYMVQQKNPFSNVEEYRFIKCLDMEPLVFLRNNLGGGSGNNTLITDYRTLLQQAVNLVKHEDFPLVYGSVDVWVDHVERKWGIYEFQPQYGYSHIDGDVHRKFTEEVIQRLVDLVME